MTNTLAKPRSRLAKILLPGLLLLAVLGWAAPSAHADDYHHRHGGYYHHYRHHRWHRYRHYYYRHHHRYYYWDRYDEFYGAPPGVSIHIGL